MTASSTPVAGLVEVLDDLARSADRQASRAAAVNAVRDSATLFTVANELRIMAERLRDAGPAHIDHAHELLDASQRLVADRILRLDRLEREVGALIRVSSGALA